MLDSIAACHPAKCSKETWLPAVKAGEEGGTDNNLLPYGGFEPVPAVTGCPLLGGCAPGPLLSFFLYIFSISADAKEIQTVIISNIELQKMNVQKR